MKREVRVFGSWQEPGKPGSWDRYALKLSMERKRIRLSIVLSG